MILKSCKADGQVVPLVLADLRSLIHKLAETGEQRDLYPRISERFWILELLNKVKLDLKRGRMVENL